MHPDRQPPIPKDPTAEFIEHQRQIHGPTADEQATAAAAAHGITGGQELDDDDIDGLVDDAFKQHLDEAVDRHQGALERLAEND